MIYGEELGKFACEPQSFWGENEIEVLTLKFLSLILLEHLRWTRESLTKVCLSDSGNSEGNPL